MSLGFAVSPVVLDLLVSKFDKSGGKNKAIEYDNFIEYVSVTIIYFPYLCFLVVPNNVSCLIISGAA